MEAIKYNQSNKINIEGDDFIDKSILEEFDSIQFHNDFSKQWLHFLCEGEDKHEEYCLKSIFIKNFFTGDKTIRPSIEKLHKFKIKNGYGQHINADTLEFAYRQDDYKRLHTLLEQLFQEPISEMYLNDFLNKVKSGNINIQKTVELHKEHPYRTFKRFV